MILRIAVEADKYDLRTALKYTSLEWLKPRINCELKETGRLLAAAYLLDDTNAFAAHTTSLILNCSESFMNLVKDELISQVLPSEILFLLEERRTRLRAEVADELRLSTIRGVCRDFGWGKTRGGKFRNLMTVRHTKWLKAKLSNALIGMERVASVDMESGGEYCTVEECYRSPSEWDRRVLDEVEILRSKASISIDFMRTKVVRRPDGVKARGEEDTTERHNIRQTSMEWSWPG